MTIPNVPGGGDPFRRTESERPTAREVRDFHTNADVDSAATAMHHTIGVNSNQASDGAHRHDGKGSRQIVLSDIIKTAPSVTGSKGGNAALASLLTQLASLGLITDNTT